MDSSKVLCACGYCDNLIDPVDKFGIPRKFVSGHNQRGKEGLRGKKSPMFGKPMPLKTKNRLKELTSGEKHWNWKGDNVGNKSLHEWVRNHLQKPLFCEFCNTVPPYDLANVTYIYNREFSNWKYLCRSCHEKYDFANGKLNRPKRDQPKDPKTGRFLKQYTFI